MHSPLLRVFIVSLLISLSQSTRLNVPVLLLPSTQKPVSFTLRAEQGCYTWVSSRPEEISVYPLSSSTPPTSLPLSSCSQYALVSALATSPTAQIRGAAIVQAQDPVTGHTLRCDVITERIQSIQIVTITRHLFTDDPPLLLTVQAMDSAGNTFSSLAGLEFDWQLISDTDTSEIVRFVRFSDADYSIAPHILSLEEVGQRGDSVLLQSVHSGSIHVRVSFCHSEDEQVVEASVTLYVMDRLYLSPADNIYLLVGSTITYSMRRAHQEGEKEVPLSKSGYVLVVEGCTCEDDDCDVVTVDQETATLTALQLGQATLALRHQSVQHESAPHLPRSSVHVVAPTYLTLSIQEEEDRWVLETGRQYHLTVHVHDSAGHVVHLSQNVMMVVELCDKFAVLDSSPNLSSHLVQTRAAGRTSILATLSSLLTEDCEEPLIPPIRVQQEVDIYEPLILLPSMLVFPWQPENELYHYQLQVLGGSGSVTWYVSDSDVATVTVNGTVLAGEKRGQAHIEASDARNPLHKAFGQVLVLMPARLQLLPQQGDCRTGETIDLPLAVWGIQDTSHSQEHADSNRHQIPNTYSPSDTGEPSQAWNGSFLFVRDCSHLLLHVHTEPAGVFTLTSESISPGSGFCGGVSLQAVAPGHTLVTVTVQTEEGNISATATLAAYSPLRALVSEVLLTLGSSRVLVFEGGPQPWPLAPARFFSSAQAQPEGGLTIEVLSVAEGRLARRAYVITCTSLGEQWLVFKCGNTPGFLNEEPSIEESRVRVECGVPDSLSVSPHSFPSPPSVPPSSHHYSCPQPQYPSSLFPVSSSRRTVLRLSVFDQKGAQFDNFTSYTVTWMRSDPALLCLLSNSTLSQADLPTQTGYKLHGLQAFQPSGQTGTVTVTVTLSSSQIWGPVISVSVNLCLMEDVQWDQRSITLYNHPRVTENLTLVQGSGHFLVHLQDKDMASITYFEETRMVQISPLHAGVSSLLAYDLCLTSPEPTVTSVTVSDISDFQMDFVDTVEVGRTAVVRVRVLDSQRQPFLYRFLRLMQLELIPSSSIVTLEEVGPVDSYSAGFRVLGQVVGLVSLHLSAVDGSGKVISSSHKHMEVYPRFNLQPRRLALALGSVWQVKWEGGPHPQSSAGFSVSDGRIANVTETGLVRGLAVGVVTLRAALQTVTQDTGALLAFAQDEVKIEVFSLTAVRIQAPLVRMSVGTEMPVYAMGSDSAQNPLALGSVEAGLSFIWSLSTPGVLEIQSRHTQAGVSVSPSHSFSVLLRALSPGRTRLKVHVQPSLTYSTNTSLSEPLTDQIQILVFEEIQLIAGTFTSILMSPHSQYALRSNKDSVCPVHYALYQCVLGAGLVTIDQQGVLRTGPDTGVALLELIATEACGINQTLLITVKVSAVWYVRVVTESSLHSKGRRALPAFPLGWRIRVTALYYDNLGKRFHAHNTRTHITTNRDDLLQVTADTDSHSFSVQTVSPGLTVLGILGDPSSPALCDYIPLPVLPAISAPPAPVRPGDTVCFSSPLANHSGQHGTWDVSSSQILQVDPETGAALAKNSGTVVVYYQLEGQKALSEVTVEAAAVPTISTPEHRFLTNWPLAPDYMVSVELYTSAANTAQCSLSQLETIEKKLQPAAELLCILHFSAPYLQLSILQTVFRTTPLYNIDTAQYSCRISVQPQSDSVLQLLSSLSLSISLSASLQTQSPLPAFPSLPSSLLPSVQLPYLAAFHCPNTHINLTPQQPVAEITVTGSSEMLNALKFHSDQPDVMLSEPSLSAENPAACLVSVYSASVQSMEKPSPLAYITIHTSLTPQIHIVRVTILNDDQTETGQLEVLQVSPRHQLFEIQLILLFAAIAFISITFIVYNSMVCRLQTVPVVYTREVADVPAASNQCFTPWIQSTQMDGPRSRRRWF